MTASAKTSPKHHRIRSLEVTGGFLQGIKMDFSDGLNCVIGGRGTGKTTVLEALRYTLDRMPNETVDRKRYEALEKLLQANLGTGSIKVELETADGVLYSVARAFGETPLVTNADGKPVDIRIGHDMHFGVDIYSQNQIEDIANNDYFQLQLIDKFIQKPLDELERQIRDATNLLETNGQKILDRKKVIGDQTEATRELPDITEKIRNFEKAEGGAQSEEMRKGHEGKSLRDRESRLVESLRTSYQESSRALTAAALEVKRRFADAIGQDFSASSNKDVIAKLKHDAQLALEKMHSHIDAAIGVLRDAEAGLNPSQSALAELHALQEQGYMSSCAASYFTRCRVASCGSATSASSRQRAELLPLCSRLLQSPDRPAADATSSAFPIRSLWQSTGRVMSRFLLP